MYPGMLMIDYREIICRSQSISKRSILVKCYWQDAIEFTADAVN
ncbi:MAG: hypothetical protein K0S74_1133 [Chlamydiales bacterium]|jgi:hypothetical protein|nr:hypothetical protein [Chlamydiales bacterium]